MGWENLTCVRTGYSLKAAVHSYILLLLFFYANELQNKTKKINKTEA